MWTAVAKHGFYAIHIMQPIINRLCVNLNRDFFGRWSVCVLWRKHIIKSFTIQFNPPAKWIVLFSFMQFTNSFRLIWNVNQSYRMPAFVCCILPKTKLFRFQLNLRANKKPKLRAHFLGAKAFLIKNLWNVKLHRSREHVLVQHQYVTFIWFAHWLIHRCAFGSTMCTSTLHTLEQVNDVSILRRKCSRNPLV